MWCQEEGARDKINVPSGKTYLGFMIRPRAGFDDWEMPEYFFPCFYG